MSKVVIEPDSDIEAARIHVPEHTTPSPRDKLTRSLPTPDKQATPKYLPQYLTPEQYKGESPPVAADNEKRARIAVQTIAIIMGVVGIYNLVASAYLLITAPSLASYLLIYVAPVHIAVIATAPGLARYSQLAYKISRFVLVLMAISGLVSQYTSTAEVFKTGGVIMLIITIFGVYILSDNSVKKLFSL